jgi:GT2 family glycosyltransferase
VNPVLMFAYNNWEMTRDAVESVFRQDIPVGLTVINNGSTDGTRDYLDSIVEGSFTAIHIPENQSPIRLTNDYLRTTLSSHEYMLGMANDVILPPNLYRLMLEWPRGFVCASQTGDRDFVSPPECRAVGETTPMAVMMIRRWAYGAICALDGHFFDEGFFHYASDCDMALRMAACGIRGVQLSIPYWHHGSAALKTSTRRREMEIQADRDRDYFERKWGFACTSLEYGQVASDPNWRACGKTQA